MNLYMAVTADKLELPLFVSPYLLEMSDKFNVKAETIKWELLANKGIQKRGIRRGYKFIKIKIDNKETT